MGIRVLTYNIHGWLGTDGQIDVDRLVHIVEDTGADLVGLNEVFHPFLSPGATEAALDVLAASLQMSYAFGAALTPQFAFAPQASYGNALLSRYPLLAHASHHLTTVEGHEQRGLLETRILLPDSQQGLSVYVTHLDHLSEKVRMEQVTALLQWTMRDRERPHLLLGDFNALAPNDYTDRPQDLEALHRQDNTRHLIAEGIRVVPRILRAGYVDAAAASNTLLPTFPADQPHIRIDYVFVSAALAASIRWCRVWESPEARLASDHLPVVTEFSWPGG